MLSIAAAQTSSKPHIVSIIVDDFGWNDIGFHAAKQANANEIITPVMDGLASEGVILDRHYVFRFCSPSRSAYQTGRNPIHVNVLNSPLGMFNLSDPVSGFSGIPRNMSTIAEKLASVGYRTIQSGKWHCGLATADHTPKGRGFQDSITYLDGANDYWTSTISAGSYAANCPGQLTDLWASDGPAYGQNNSWSCSQAHQPSSCVYEDDIFTNFVLDKLQAHDPSQPFFLYFTPHSIHEPLEVPQAQLDKFAFINNSDRQAYAAMVNNIDTHIGRIVQALKDKGMWNNTLLMLTADNGGPIYNNGTAGANNYPLHGGKRSNWEGGVRVNALVSGGFIPAARRGAVEEGLVGIEDWYTTFCNLAGVDPFDARGAAAGLPPVDGLDMWPLLSGANSTSPRTEIIMGSSGPTGLLYQSGDTVVQGLIRSDGYKLLWGQIEQDIWTGPFYPNASTSWPNNPRDCGSMAAPTCLYNVFTDPTEHLNVAAQNPDVVQSISARIAELQQTVFNPQRGAPGHQACDIAHQQWKGFVGPFLP